MTTRQHNVAAAILLIVGALLIRVGAVDAQPYPELTQVSPLVTLLQSMSSDVGNSAIAMRWFAIVSVGMGMWLVYLIGKQFLTHNGAVQAMVIAGVSLPWITYGRQSNSDIVGVVLALASLYAMQHVVGSVTKVRQAIFVALFLVLCAIAGITSLTTILAVSATGLTVVIAFQRWSALVIVAGGLVASRVWLLSLGEPGAAYTLPHEVGTMLFSLPMAVAAFMWLLGMFAVKELRAILKDGNVRSIAALLILGVAVVAVNSERSLLMLVWVAPFASLLSVHALEQFRRQNTPTMLLTALIVVIATTYAALSYYTTHFTAMLRLASGIAGVAWLGYMLFAVLRGHKITTRLQLVVRLFTPAYYGAIAIHGFIAAVLIMFGSPFVINGARSVSREASSLAIGTDEQVVFLYHARPVADVADAQLRYYMEAPYRRVELPARGVDADIVNGSVGSRQIIYFHPGDDRAYEAAVDTLLSASYNALVQTKDYTLYNLR